MHWNDRTFARKNYVLHAIHFPEEHTAVNIAEKFEKMCHDWKIEPSRQHVIVADGARNMQRGLGGCLDVEHCSIHNLQLCINVSNKALVSRMVVIVIFMIIVLVLSVVIPA